MKTLILALAFTLSASAVAQPADITQIDIPRLGKVDYELIFEERGLEGETLDQFAKRISPYLRKYSDATGYEACGVIATDGTVFGVVVGSNRSHIACANFSKKVPAGMRATEDTIHSHGKVGRYTPNHNDRRLAPQHFESGATLSLPTQYLDKFSPADYEGGSGYLAGSQSTLHQKGKRGTERTISPEL